MGILTAKSRSLAILASALVGILVPNVTAQNVTNSEQGSQPDSGVPTEPSVVVSLTDTSQKVVAWRAVRLQVTVVNGSIKSGIGVDALSLSVPSNLAVASDGYGKDQNGSLKVIDSSFQMRSAGERRDLPTIELRPKYLKEMKGSLFSILTDRPQRESVVATLVYRPLGGDVDISKTGRYELPVVPNPLGIYFGAICGALLAALLIPVHRLASSLTRDDSQSVPEVSIRTESFKLLARFARGAVATGIAVLVLQTTADFSFPVSVTVQDFYGGVLLGLFGDKVAESILNRIASLPTAHPSAEAQTETAPS